MQKISEENIRLRHKNFTRGQRVRALAFANDGGVDDNLSVPPGTEGEVLSVDALGTVHVLWDNGSSLGALVEDKIERCS